MCINKATGARGVKRFANQITPIPSIDHDANHPAIIIRFVRLSALPYGFEPEPGALPLSYATHMHMCARDVCESSVSMEI